MAIPSSGTISLAGIRAELATNTYNASATTIASLEDCSDGTIATINTGNASGDRPNGSAPHSMSEFYAYDHDVSSFNDNVSFDFDGSNDYLSGSGTLASIATLEQIGSVSMWVKLDSMSANGVMFQITEEEGTDNQIFILWQNAVGKIRGAVKLDGVANLVDSGSGLENDDNWHHIAMTWIANQRSGNIVRMYVDGSQTDTDAINNTWSSGSPPANITLGRNHLQNNAYFNGHIDDLAMFDDVLTASEVSSIYNSGTPKDESGHSGLVAYFTMEAYSDGDSTVADDSSNNNAFTINNNTNIDSNDTP